MILRQLRGEKTASKKQNDRFYVSRKIMKCFTWIQGVVHARNHNGHEKMNEAAEPAEQQHTGYVRSSEMKLPRISSAESILNLGFEKDNKPLRDMIEQWDHTHSNRDSLQPLISMGYSTIFTRNNCHTRKSSRPLVARRKTSTSTDYKETTDLPEASLACDYNPAIQAYISSGRAQQSKPLQRREKSSASTSSTTSTLFTRSAKSATSTTSTIHHQSLLAPVTILVTTPDDDPTPPPLRLNTEPNSQPTNPFASICAHRLSSSTRLHPIINPPPITLTPNSKPTLNTTLLMPPLLSIPLSSHSTQCALRQEYASIRLYLITFLNTKSASFPRKLRVRLMEACSISDADLDPGVVRNYQLLDLNTNNDRDGRDEGVALGSEDGSEKDDLEILSMALRSHVSVLPHHRRQHSISNPGHEAQFKRRSTDSKPFSISPKHARPISYRSNTEPTSPSSSTRQSWAVIEGIDPTAPIHAYIRPSKTHFHSFQPSQISILARTLHKYSSSMEAPTVADLKQAVLAVKETQESMQTANLKIKGGWGGGGGRKRQSFMAGLSSSLHDALSKPRMDERRP